MSRLQEEFDFQSGDFQLPRGEYEGPLVINRTCVVDGGGATLWARRGPVLTIEAEGVTVQNLRVETPEASAPSAVIEIRASGAQLSGVEVNGDISGLPGEAEGWHLPPVITLGDFAAGQKNTFSCELDLPMDAILTCRVHGLRVTPSMLRCGKNRIMLETDSVGKNMILYGELMIETSVSRRIVVTGRALENAPVRRATVSVSETAASRPVTADTSVPSGLNSSPAPAVTEVVRGQHLSAKGLSNIRIAYGCAGVRRFVDMDAYVFLLQGNGRVSSDRDLIFFGNPAAESGCARISGENGTETLLELDKAPVWVQKIAVCFSIYGNTASENFSLVDRPALRVFGGGQELYRFVLSGLALEKTVVAVEIYRYRGDWKFNFVGAGYSSGLATLCRSYGVDVM